MRAAATTASPDVVAGKSLAPIYEKVGTTFKNDKHVRRVLPQCAAAQSRGRSSSPRWTATSTATRLAGRCCMTTLPLFTLRSYGVTGFPTLKWFPKNNKEGEDVCCATC